MLREDALKIFHAAVAAVQPDIFMRNHVKIAGEQLEVGEKRFDLGKTGKIVVIGAGKASAAMANALESILENRISGGLIVTKSGHSMPLQYLSCMEAGHPVPDENSLLATQKVESLLYGLSENDIVICLISGGASSLLADHPPGSSLKELKVLFSQLLQCGASIHEINAVRKHLSLIKGGQLVRLAHPASIVSFILSDVVGDQLDVIASGLTVPDPRTFADAWKILEKYKLVDMLSPSLKEWLLKGLAGELEDTPKPGDPIFSKTYNLLVGTNRIALNAAAGQARTAGYHPVIMTSEMTGEARDQAIQIVDQTVAYKGPRRACLLWGGETTVTIKGNGTGGRNQELALASLIYMKETLAYSNPFPLILSAGTDGSDGPTDATGAIVDKETLIQAEIAAISMEEFLDENDSYHFFELAGGHIITGPTHTNVMDVVIALIG